MIFGLGQMERFVQGFHDENAVKQMQYNRLGQTDMVVSKLSLGGGPFGDLYNTCSQEIVDFVVSNGVKRGINFIDTAYWYGQGKSEERLGKALSNIPRSAYYIGTKVGRYELPKLQRFDFSAEKTMQSIENSLVRLQLPSVDLIQIHDIEYAMDEKIILEETLPALQKLKDAGKTRYIGITGYPLSVLCSILQKSTVHIDTVLTYCRATLNDSSLQDYIHILQEKNVGVINAGAVSLGLLTPQGPPFWHPAHDDIKAACQQAVAYCKDAGVSVAKLALNYSVNFPGVHTTLVGMDRTEVLDECLASATTSLTKAEADCSLVLKERFFSNLRSTHWEGVEPNIYFEYMKKQKST